MPTGKLITLRGSEVLRKRLRMAGVEENMTYAQLIERMLDERDERLGRGRGVVLTKPLGR